MQSALDRINAAIEAFKQGKMVILTDDPDRENEGDLIIPAELITASLMNFIIRNSSGIVCLSMTKNDLHRLDLPLMVPPQANSSLRGTPFTISIDAKDDITTGVSATDRAKTVLAAIAENAKASDLVRPGHIFPLQAKDGGVLERQGHTEGALDLAVIAGYKPSAVLCEVMNADGTMTRGKQLEEFAKEHDLVSLSIDDIMTYRLQQESMIEESAESLIQTEKYGEFKVSIVKERYSELEHIVLVNEKSHSQEKPLVRIHSSCATGDLFGSKRCDCQKQLHHSLQRIHAEGGVLIYLNQEGRGIGLLNKIKAYELQEHGLDTIEANIKLGLPVDARKYFIAAHILKSLNIDSIRLLTNNPAKLNDMRKYGIANVEHVSLPSFHNEHNQRYLQTKLEKLHHVINFDLVSNLTGI